MILQHDAEAPAVEVSLSDNEEKFKTKLAEVLLSAVNETIRSIFKEDGAKVIFEFLEKSYHLKLQEIVEKPEIFSIGFERLTVSAASLMERMILENAYLKLGFNFEAKDGYKFADYVQELRGKIDAGE